MSNETATIEAGVRAATNRGPARSVLELLGSEEQFDELWDPKRMIYAGDGVFEKWRES